MFLRELGLSHMGDGQVFRKWVDRARVMTRGLVNELEAFTFKIQVPSIYPQGREGQVRRNIKAVSVYHYEMLAVFLQRWIKNG